MDCSGFKHIRETDKLIYRGLYCMHKLIQDNWNVHLSYGCSVMPEIDLLAADWRLTQTIILAGSRLALPKRGQEKIFKIFTSQYGNSPYHIPENVK